MKVISEKEEKAGGGGLGVAREIIGLKYFSGETPSCRLLLQDG